MSRRERYGRWAALLYRSLIDPAVASLRPTITRICLEEGVALALDIACATGAQCRALAAAGIRATGVDLSEPMIEAARAASIAGPEFVLGSALDLPFTAASFDAAILSLALHEHPEEDRTAMLREAGRVLRPGGLLLVADYRRPSLAPLHPPWQIVRLVESAAGPEHRSGFRDFVARGGVDSLLARNGLTSLRTLGAVFGTVAVAAVRREA